jgi:hypothetical protein
MNMRAPPAVAVDDTTLFFWLAARRIMPMTVRFIYKHFSFH